MRILNVFVSILCILLGSLITLTSAAMVLSVIASQDPNSEAVIWVGLISLIFSPIVFIAGIRILLKKPNIYGGIFSPYMLRTLGAINGVIGGLILLFSLGEPKIIGIISGVSFIVTTQLAFTKANIRAHD